MSRHIARALLALVAVLAMLSTLTQLTGCGGGDDESDKPIPRVDCKANQEACQ